MAHSFLPSSKVPEDRKGGRTKERDYRYRNPSEWFRTSLRVCGIDDTQAESDEYARDRGGNYAHRHGALSQLP